MTENELFNETNDYIRKAQSLAEGGEPRRAVSCYECAAAKLEQLMRYDRAYYQKYLYAVYDEIGIIMYNELSDHRGAYTYFTKAYDNCLACADRDPNGAAVSDLSYIRSRKNTAASAM